MTPLTHLDWRPVILLKVIRSPYGVWGGLSVKRAYLAAADERLLLADWTLEADERARDLVCPTGWALSHLPGVPFRLYGRGNTLIPSGTWVVPYTEAVFSLYQRAGAAFDRCIAAIDSQPLDPALLSALRHFTDLF
jgi:hypothetical protein